MGELAVAGGREGAQLCDLTTKSNELCGELHDRMTVILGPQTWPAWLGEEPVEVAQLKALLVPHPADEMTGWSVNPTRRQHQNNDAGLLEPISIAGQGARFRRWEGR